jgi:UDPglucose--hexose-1-phosphate uridylyltransferase
LRYILLLKNHGEAAGASLEHTHAQPVALPVVPIQVQ